MFSLSVAEQRIGQSVTQLEGSQKRRGGMQQLVVHGQSVWGSRYSTPSNSAFQDLRAVEYGREGHLGLMCDVLFEVFKVEMVLICICISFL